MQIMTQFKKQKTNINMDEKLKTELDLISDSHQNIIKSIFIKERLDQTKNAYKREYYALEKDLMKKSDEYGLVKDKDVENYIQELCEKYNLTFQNLLDF